MTSLERISYWFTMTSVTAQSLHGGWLSWFQGWQAVSSFLFVLSELQAKL